MNPGDTLPPWELPITPTLVVSTAIATRDFQDVHHDRDLAQSHGSQDIFLNILTSTGLVERYVTDHLGHDTDVLGIAIRLGAPGLLGELGGPDPGDRGLSRQAGHARTRTVPVTWSPSDTAPRTSTTATPSSTDATEPVNVRVS